LSLFFSKHHRLFFSPSPPQPHIPLPYHRFFQSASLASHFDLLEQLAIMVLVNVLGLIAAAARTVVDIPFELTHAGAPRDLSLPQNDANIELRTEQISAKQDRILYGPSLLGNTSFFPIGENGTAIVNRDFALWAADAMPVQNASALEAADALKDINAHGGLQTIEDYKILYEGNWQTTVPNGIAEGVFENKTSDLLFSMERLSVNPYILKRLNPAEDAVPFDVDVSIVQELTGSSLSTLLEAGRLFLADHGYQKEYTPQEGRYLAYTSALFFISNTTRFLPLAIKTNTGADLVYTPLDEDNDWQLAKIMFAVNDLFHSQMFHLANSHAVAEIINLAALRTLGDNHPVLAYLNRIMYQAYALRLVGERILFNNSGYWDQSFALPNTAARDFATDSYPTVTGPFRANFFEQNLRSRGLIDAEYGPELPRFPFYEDGTKLIAVIREFVESFVNSLYESDADLEADWEIQAWIEEANGPAEVLDFPPAPLTSRTTLIDILSHLAWLTGVSHHVLNQGEPVTASGVLPFHPASLFAPLPEEKGTVESLLPWLPNEEQSVTYLSLLARFNRPGVVAKQQTTKYMFNDEVLLKGTGEAVKAANAKFIEGMDAISKEISGRKFDSEGLSQGMPVIWKGMDPGLVPFFLSV
jgi:hypothetical protein